ncbi:hypothetical protein HK096_009163, partial [Nowakowskiella sp. JEL0078]
DDDEDENQEKTVIYTNRKTTFDKITIRYVSALAWVALMYTISSFIQFGLIFKISQLGRRLQRAAQVPYFVRTQLSGLRYLASADPISPFSSSFILTYLCNAFPPKIRYYRDALYNGNSTLSVSTPTFDSYMIDFFFTKRYQTDLYSLDDLTMKFLQFNLAICKLSASSINLQTEVFLNLQNITEIVANGYMEHAIYINELYQTFQSNLYTTNTNIILPIFLLCVILLYFKNLRQILEKIAEENERTLRLTLMLPINLVGEIDSIKKMLHLDQTYDVPELAALNDGSSNFGSATFSPFSGKPKLIEKLDMIDENEGTEGLNTEERKIIENELKFVNDFETPVNDSFQPEGNVESSESINFFEKDTKKYAKKLQIPRLSSFRRNSTSSEGIRKSISTEIGPSSKNILKFPSMLHKNQISKSVGLPDENITTNSERVTVEPPSNEEIINPPRQ